MNEPISTPIPPDDQQKPKTWLIVIIVIVVLLCACFGIVGLLIAFGPAILNALGLSAALPILALLP